MATAIHNASNHGSSTKPASFLRRVLIPAILVLAGIAILLYPVVSSQWNNFMQQKAAEQYTNYNETLNPDTLERELAEAVAYNEDPGTGGPILDPWLARVAKDNHDYQRYLEQLNHQEAMARLVVPAAKVDLPVYHGTESHTLERGVGHLYGTSMPVGGPNTHSVLTAHTGLPHATLFDNLDQVEEGDAIYIDTAGQKMKYEVHDVEVVLPTETDSLNVVPGEDLVTLITCTPYGINTHRILVHAHRVAYDPAEEAFENNGPVIQWWMWVLIAAAIIILALLARWLYRQYLAAKIVNVKEESNDV
ncbi:class C sortase [Corynebacterium cystitidis]|uniref:Sortase A n=1 Tax=Corynebacterium cystitidis DSM 20524 TaxID=1121357 RepID=A0A1H9SQ07_9CORY|nr:class C sortase [Corynebacterium cystitidis]WJY83114.1 Sortase family protein [Corynebacterium cystitidis DSM 20524]SER86493.1 sortase A [Corynebacterium cystitidis DSM 20524]SNV66412.1 fimbrial associated sortase-like protein [Corynebacterium cystitidis]